MKTTILSIVCVLTIVSVATAYGYDDWVCGGMIRGISGKTTGFSSGV